MSFLRAILSLFKPFFSLSEKRFLLLFRSLVSSVLIFVLTFSPVLPMLSQYSFDEVAHVSSLLLSQLLFDFSTPGSALILPSQRLRLAGLLPDVLSTADEHKFFASLFRVDKKYDSVSELADTFRAGGQGLIGAPEARAATTYYWVGSAGGGTSDASNWATIDPGSCTGGGAGTPTSVDTIIFDPDCDNNASINADLSVATFTIQSGYSGAITQSSGFTVTVGSGGYSQSDGTFTGGNSAVDINGDFTLATGTFVAPSATMYVAGSFTRSSGTFTHNSGTVVLDAQTGSETLTNTDSFNKLIVNDGLVGYWKLDETSGGDTAVDASGYGNDGTPAGATGTNNKPQPDTDIPTTNFTNARSLDFDGTDDDVDVSGTSSVLDFDDTQSFTLMAWFKTTFTGSLPAIIAGKRNGVNSGQAGYNLQVFGAPGTIRAEIADGATQEGAGSGEGINDGGWHHAAMTVNGSTNSGVLYSDGSSVGTPSYTVSPATVADFVIGYADGGGIGSSYFPGNIDEVRVYSRALSSGEISALYAGNQPSTSSATYTLASAITVADDLVLNSGTLDVSGSNYGVSVAGNFENNGGVFTAQSGTVTLNGGSQEVNSSNTFYNLIKSVSSAYTLTFGAGSTTTVSNSLTLSGAASNLLTLVSSLTGTAFKIDPQSSVSVSYVDVSDSNNISGTTITASNSQSASGGNTDWCLVGSCSISGTAYSDEGVTPLTSNTVALSINGASATTTETHASTGAFSFTGLSLSADDIVTLYLDDETADGVTVTNVPNGSAMTGVDIYQDRLIIRSDSGTALTNDNLDTANNNGDSDISAIYSTSGNALTVVTGKELFIPTSQSFTPGGTVTIGTSGITSSFDMRGTYTQGAESLELRGDYSQPSGTFNGGSGNVTVTNFTLSGGTFTSTSGTFDVGGSSTGAGTGSWTHTAGGTFTHNSGAVKHTGSGATWNVATSETFYNLEVDVVGSSNTASGSRSLTVSSGDTLIVVNTFTHTDGAINTGTIEARGSVSVGADTAGDPLSSATLSFLVTGDQVITGNGGQTLSLNINKSSGTYARFRCFCVYYRYVHGRLYCRCFWLWGLDAYGWRNVYS